MRNWITFTHGAVILGLLVFKIWAPAEWQGHINDTIGVLTATGFFAAKDFNNHSTTTEVAKAQVEADIAASK